MKLAFFIAVFMGCIVSLPHDEVRGALGSGEKAAHLARSIRGFFHKHSYNVGEKTHNFALQVEALDQVEQVITHRLALIHKYVNEVGSDAFDGKIRMKTNLKSPYLEYTLIHTNYTREDYEVEYGDNINEMVYVADLNYVVDYQIFGTLEGMRLFFFQKMAAAVNRITAGNKAIAKEATEEITALQRLYSMHVNRILAVTNEISDIADNRIQQEFPTGGVPATEGNQWAELAGVVARMNSIRHLLTDSLTLDSGIDGLRLYAPELTKNQPD